MKKGWRGIIGDVLGIVSFAYLASSLENAETKNEELQEKIDDLEGMSLDEMIEMKIQEEEEPET